jgi:deoxycytidylate deaminase
MLPSLSEITKDGERIASKSQIRVKVACLLYDRRTGKLVATGYNKLGTRNLNGRHSVHAEVDALRKIRKPSYNLVMVLYRKGGILITPCHACMVWIRAYGITEVYYTARVI